MPRIFGTEAFDDPFMAGRVCRIEGDQYGQPRRQLDRTEDQGDDHHVSVSRP